MRNPELWARLQAFEFDGQGSAPFSVKLARAEGWDAGLTARVIEEYRKFLYLTQVSHTQVTPSEAVDAAWHMHMTYTRTYWDALCGEVLGKPLHHEPCAGDEEMPRYRDQFHETRLLYASEFEQEPPREIWGSDAPLQRPPLRDKNGITGEGLLVLAVIMCVGLYFVWPEAHFIVYALIIGVALLLSNLITPKNQRRGRRTSDGWDFDADLGLRRRVRDSDDASDTGPDSGCGGGCGGD